MQGDVAGTGVGAAAMLLAESGVVVSESAVDIDHVAAWADSGLMLLTGPAAGPPLAVKSQIPQRLSALARAATTLGARLGSHDIDAPRLVSDRARRRGLRRNGPSSPNGSCHAIAAADGWWAINLAREEDLELLPALVGDEGPAPTDAVSAVDWLRSRCEGRSATSLVGTAREMGLAVAAFDLATDAPVAPFGIAAQSQGSSPEQPVVVDLAPLWAGPLAAQLLRGAGARVIRVVTPRGGGLAEGDPVLHRALHAGKELHAIDPRSAQGRQDLAQLVASADVVIEGSRPRVAASWGIDPEALVASGTTWVSITGHGRSGDAAAWVGFGDDAAVAGGAWLSGPDGEPNFIGDALADPVAALVAAVAVLASQRTGTSALIDVAMSGAVRWLLGGSPPVTAPNRVGADPGRRDEWVVAVDSRSIPVR